MRSPAVTVVLAVVVLFAATPADAQEKFTFKDGMITFDKKGFKDEYDKMQRDLDLQARSKKAARSLFKNVYCVDCAGPPTEKLRCRSIVGGKIGAALCTLGGAVSCPAGANVGNVTEGPC